ncbi:hypothetical protein MTR_4g024700 [Medicago truncatula]|uniref:Uncharacterized protein n=1 Tax=Medicago truncatula TaxID=3880 RepID=G7JEP2_MEDTR|nr:hypothetical protein MTR_4g024700 [Medicago truncatula]
MVNKTNPNLLLSIVRRGGGVVFRCGGRRENSPDWPKVKATQALALGPHILDLE